MASVSPQGERTLLALIAEQYAAIVELREELATARLDLEHERSGRLADLQTYESALEAVEKVHLESDIAPRGGGVEDAPS